MLSNFPCKAVVDTICSKIDDDHNRTDSLLSDLGSRIDSESNAITQLDVMVSSISDDLHKLSEQSLSTIVALEEKVAEHVGRIAELEGTVALLIEENNKLKSEIVRLFS